MQSGNLFWNDQKIHNLANFLILPQAAYTPQIPQLFSASLRDNLLLGLAGKQIENELARAIATAIFEQDVTAMPNGLETLVGTQGFRLSGGQKQRAAAARMLLRQSQLLVFDDLSSALDIKTEEQLWNKLLKPTTAKQSSTYLAVSHRLSVLNRADQIIVLEAGQIADVKSFSHSSSRW